MSLLNKKLTLVSNVPLHLNLKRQWFDMIKSGEKKEEYREIKPYWNKRLLDNNGEIIQYKQIIFSNGYSSKNRPQFIAEVKNISTNLGKPQWGADPGTYYYVFELGTIYTKE